MANAAGPMLHPGEDLLDPWLDARAKGWPLTQPPLRRSQVGAQGWRLLAGDLPLPLAVIRRTALQHNLRAGQHRVVIDTSRAVGILRGDLGLQVGGFLGRDAGDIDLRTQRFAQRRLHRQAAEAQCPGLRGEQTSAGDGDASQRNSQGSGRAVFQGKSPMHRSHLRLARRSGRAPAGRPGPAAHHPAARRSTPKLQQYQAYRSRSSCKS